MKERLEHNARTASNSQCQPTPSLPLAYRGLRVVLPGPAACLQPQSEAAAQPPPPTISTPAGEPSAGTMSTGLLQSTHKHLWFRVSTLRPHAHLSHPAHSQPQANPQRSAPSQPSIQARTTHHRDSNGNTAALGPPSRQAQEPLHAIRPAGPTTPSAGAGTRQASQRCPLRTNGVC